MTIALSPLDQRRFGHVTAKVDIAADDDLPGILSECAQQQVQFLIARCPTGHVRKVQELERLGFFLTDTLVHFRKDPISRGTPALPAGLRTRLAVEADAPELERLAARAFHGYGGHYHADPRLDPALCDQVYASWAANCAGGNACTAMILLTDEGSGAIAGFAALRRCGDATFDGVLFGVDPAHQGRGLFRHLLHLSQRWGVEQGFSAMLYSTQLTNLRPQWTLCREGFVPVKSFYTLHKWFA
jgi:GNAT superfamily N-acetyltransferase